MTNERSPWDPQTLAYFSLSGTTWTARPRAIPSPNAADGVVEIYARLGTKINDTHTATASAYVSP